jgi:hypothetical protein
MNRRRHLIILGSAAVLSLTGCETNEASPGPSISPEPSASAGPSPSSSASVTTPPAPEPPPPASAPPPPAPEPGEGSENDPGPGYVDTSFVYPAVVVDSSTIPPAQLGNYVHFEFYLDAVANTPASSGVTQYVCVASFNGFHDCATIRVGDTMVPLDVYLLPGSGGLHFGMSDSATPMTGAFYYFEDIPNQPGFTAGSDFRLEAVLTFDDTQNGFGIFLPTMILKD